MSEGFDVGLEMSGSPAAFRDLLAAMHHGGGIALLGFLPPETRIDWDQLIFKGLTVKGIYGREIFRTWQRHEPSSSAPGLDIAPVITHRFCRGRLPAGLRNGALGTVRQGPAGVGVTDRADEHFRAEVESLRSEGLYKRERVITSPQGAIVDTREAGRVLNFCANNYLGLADHPEVIEAARAGARTHGFGMASVRFICGTQDLHKRPRGPARRLPRHRGRDPVLVVLRRQRRPVRDAARRPDDAIISRRAQPRLDHRRHPPVQGPAAGATATTTWTTSRAA